MLVRNGTAFTDSIFKKGLWTLRATIEAGTLTTDRPTHRAQTAESHMGLDLNINLDSNLLLKAEYFIWWEEVGHICLPLESHRTLWSGGAPAAASGFLMKSQGNRKQVQSRLTFPTPLLRATMGRGVVVSRVNGLGGVCPSLKPKYQPDARSLLIGRMLNKHPGSVSVWLWHDFYPSGHLLIVIAIAACVINLS